VTQFSIFSMNIYVANINFRAQEDQLKELFQQYGEVASVKIVTDRETGRSRGFAFIEMPNDSEGKEAINKLNGVGFLDRNLVVNEARPAKGR
jgi:RNA recognition motif-containing protein